MGYRKTPTIYTLADIKGEDGLIVRMKAIRVGRLRKLMGVLGEGDDGKLDEMFELLLEGLVSWNLEDEDGVPVPTTMEGLEQCEMPFVLAILEVWLENMTGPDADLGKGSPAGAQFPGRPLTMEAL